MSIDTVVFDEKCLAEEESVQPQSQTSHRVPEDDDCVYQGHRIDATSPCLDQEQPEVEHGDAASEVDRNAGPEPIDALDEEVEQRTDQELEYLEQLSGVSKDKQTGQCGDELVEEMDDPPAKRTRLICDEGRAVASPEKIKRFEEKRSETGANSTPRITSIETVRYNVSPMKKMEKNGIRGSFL